MSAEFNTTREELGIINQIADRVFQDYPEVVYLRLDLDMDLSAVHSNGCPLDFEKLLKAPPFDFAHDVFGIKRNINRQTGELDNCFVPRCARPEIK